MRVRIGEVKAVAARSNPVLVKLCLTKNRNTFFGVGGSGVYDYRYTYPLGNFFPFFQVSSRVSDCALAGPKSARALAITLSP